MIIVCEKGARNRLVYIYLYKRRKSKSCAWNTTKYKRYSNISVKVGINMEDYVNKSDEKAEETYTAIPIEHYNRGYYGVKKYNPKILLFLLAGALLLLPSSINSQIKSIMGQVALFSTAVIMPISALDTLKENLVREIPQLYYIPQISQEGTPAIDEPSTNTKDEDIAQPLPQSEAESQPDEIQEPPPEIPQEFQGALVQETMLGSGSSLAFYNTGDVWIRNYTKLNNTDIEQVLSKPANITVSDNEQPQVLIYHTHATEAFEKYDSDIYDTRNTWRSTDDAENMVAVGNVLAKALEAEGINVIHDYTQHDYPSYNGSYDRSRETVEYYLEKYPSITVALDLHRDGIIRDDGSIVKPVAEIDGEKAAQLMIIAPYDDGTNSIPNWRENLRFSVDLTAAIEELYPELSRPIYFMNYHYNLDLTDGSLLLEFGSNANTLEEAFYTAELIAKPLADTINSYKEVDNIE